MQNLRGKQKVPWERKGLTICVGVHNSWQTQDFRVSGDPDDKTLGAVLKLNFATYPIRVPHRASWVSAEHR